jgi:serine/threonine-protein kinase
MRDPVNDSPPNGSPPNGPPPRGEKPSSTSLLIDRLVDDGRELTHEERIQQLVIAAIPDPERRLKLEGELARGGMGAVRSAFDATLQRRMAAKTMHASTYEHVMLVHGFLREAQVTGQLDHPNIVPIHELGRDAKGELYFTMKLVEGQSLKTMIGGGVALDSDRLLNLLEIFVKVCDALGFAHARGCLHCDIKSANVMVGEFGQVYLMDWGGAQLLPPRPGVDTRKWVRDSLPPLPIAETKGLVFGTPSYMSPEQASAGREPMDERSDIFSMGALLYEIMTGRPPYHGSTALEAIMLAQLCDIRPPDELPQVPPNTYPRELVRIVMKALSKRPDDRYSSVAGLKLDILKLMRGGGNFSTIRVARGAHVIRQGEVGDAAYIVVSGKLEVYKTIDGERVSLRMLGPGDMFGETAIFASSPRTASVVVIEDASLVLVTSDVIEQELQSMKPWMGAFIRTLASRFGGLEEERRARTHSGPAVSAAQLPVTGHGHSESVGPLVSPLNTTYHAPPNSKLSGPSDSPLNARPAASYPPVHSRAVDTSAVPEDRSDITVVADLMAETGGRDDEPSLAAPGESVMIDLGDDDDAPEVGATISSVTERSLAGGESVVEADSAVVEADGEAEDAATRLIGPWTRKPPPPRP